MTHRFETSSLIVKHTQYINAQKEKEYTTEMNYKTNSNYYLRKESYLKIATAYLF